VACFPRAHSGFAARGDRFFRRGAGVVADKASMAGPSQPGRKTMKKPTTKARKKPKARDEFNRRWVQAKHARRNEALKYRRVMRPNL
jgi:hypothetical protein